MNCRQFKPVVMPTGSCSRMWSGGFWFASPPSSLLLQVPTDLADISWKAMRNHFKTIKWRGQIWGKRWKSCSPFPPHAPVYVLYQSSHRDSSYLTFSCYTHSCCSCIQPCYRKQMLWHLSTPSDVKLPSSLCGVIVCWVLEAEVLPSLLTRMLKISSVLPNACACELQTVEGGGSRLLS